MAVAQKVIYAAYAPAGDTPVYIGRTSRGLQRRIAEHLHDAVDALHGPDRFHEWLRLNLNAEWKVLEELPDDATLTELAAKEAWWIRKFLREGAALENSVLPRGYYLDLDLLAGVR